MFPFLVPVTDIAIALQILEAQLIFFFTFGNRHDLLPFLFTKEKERIHLFPDAMAA